MSIVESYDQLLINSWELETYIFNISSTLNVYTKVTHSSCVNIDPTQSSICIQSIFKHGAMAQEGEWFILGGCPYFSENDRLQG